MSQDIEANLIGKYLSIKPINHGKVYTFQIAIPNARKQDISLERRRAIEKSLLTHQSNVISIIIRRTDAYDDEDIEYELVYGADWLQIAQDLEVEKVWAWVFDMTDDQVEATIAEMDQLTGSYSTSSTSSTTSATEGISSQNSDINIEALLDRKLQFLIESIKHAIHPTLNRMRAELEEQLQRLNYRIDTLSLTNNESDALNLQTIASRLDTIQAQLVSPRRQPTSLPIEPLLAPINLLTATAQEIRNALKSLGTKDKQIDAAVEAVEYWRKSKHGLTWKNLKSSATAKDTPPKIKGFSTGTLERLNKVADIPKDL